VDEQQIRSASGMKFVSHLAGIVAMCLFHTGYLCFLLLPVCGIMGIFAVYVYYAVKYGRPVLWYEYGVVDDTCHHGRSPGILLTMIMDVLLSQSNFARKGGYDGK
jgi:hypothetical protein